MKDLSITALQLDLAWQDPAANLKNIENHLARLDSVGDLLVLPEMFTTAFTMDAAGQAEPMHGSSMQWMQQVAKQYDCAVMGSLVIEEGGNYYNRMLVMEADGLSGQYDKRHPFSYAKEHLTYTAGSQQVVLEVDGWNICPQICYDLRFPVWSRNRPTGENALAYDLLVYVANWPDTRVLHWEALLMARAIENQAYVIGVNRVGTDAKGLNYSGSSMIVNPGGGVLAYEQHKEAALSATLSAESMQHYRQKFTFWRDADAFTIAQADNLSSVDLGPNLAAQ